MHSKKTKRRSARVDIQYTHTNHLTSQKRKNKMTISIDVEYTGNKTQQ